MTEQVSELEDWLTVIETELVHTVELQALEIKRLRAQIKALGATPPEGRRH
jgi:hypothetical protein